MRGGACSPPCLRVRPVEVHQPLVVVHPLAIRKTNQADDVQKADSINLAGVKLCEHLMREESAPGCFEKPEASDENVFCPRFCENETYKEILTARYVTGKEKRAAAAGSQVDSAEACGSESEEVDEPDVPETWRSAVVFSEPPPRPFNMGERTCTQQGGAKKRRRFDDSDGATSESTEEGSDSDRDELRYRPDQRPRSEMPADEASVIASAARGEALVPSAVNWKQIASNANQRMQEALLEGSGCEVV